MLLKYKNKPSTREINARLFLSRLTLPNSVPTRRINDVGGDAIVPGSSPVSHYPQTLASTWQHHEHASKASSPTWVYSATPGPHYMYTHKGHVMLLTFSLFLFQSIFLFSEEILDRSLFLSYPSPFFLLYISFTNYYYIPLFRHFLTPIRMHFLLFLNNF